jgi:hypothetical protein
MDTATKPRFCLSIVQRRVFAWLVESGFHRSGCPVGRRDRHNGRLVKFQLILRDSLPFDDLGPEALGQIFVSIEARLRRWTPRRSPRTNSTAGVAKERAQRLSLLTVKSRDRQSENVHAPATIRSATTYRRDSVMPATLIQLR